MTIHPRLDFFRRLYRYRSTFRIRFPLPRHLSENEKRGRSISRVLSKGHHLSGLWDVAVRFLQSTRGRFWWQSDLCAPAAWLCSWWGLPYPVRCRRTGGGLLPRLFTLTAVRRLKRGARQRYIFCGALCWQASA